MYSADWVNISLALLTPDTCDVIDLVKPNQAIRVYCMLGRMFDLVAVTTDPAHN